MADEGNDTDRSQWRFGRLLRWHLKEHGTRPNLSGEAWTETAFGNVVGVSDRTVRNWLNGQNVPEKITKIESALFGENRSSYSEWRREFLRAWARARDPGPPLPVSNVPISVPAHFMGRDDALTAIAAVFASNEGRLAVAITALHGLRGVGKSTLAAAYAERHSRK